jgi:arginyl-tRNA synthetase
LRKILKEKENYGKSKIGKGKTVIIDYSSPNIAKPFGIGHLRSTIIGQALYNIYKFLGYKVIGDNHLGDWGTQFGKLIFAIKNWGKKKVEDYSIEELEELYVKFHKEAEKNPQLEEEGRKWFKKLEEGNRESKKIWKALVKISLKEFKRIYKLLGVKFDFALGEGFYEPMTKKVIRELKEKKIAKESQGALIVEFPKNEFPPVIVQKSDGTTTYFTRDLATIKYRLKKWNPDLIIYEVGADQKLHFQQLFKTVEILGWSRKTKFVHVAHGLYRTKTGKFSTRKGETVHLEDVLKEAIERAKEIIEKSETSRGLTEREKERVAKIVGIGAVKYNDLSQHPSKDIIFDWEKVLNLKGNSAPYLQYTFVRCQSVLMKAGSRKLEVGSRKLQIEKLKKEEIDILREIYKFPEIVQEAAEKFSPNLICNFIFDLAKKYNLFYDLYPILKAEDEEIKNFRLILTKSVAQIIKNSLSLLGIQTPEKM